MQKVELGRSSFTAPRTILYSTHEVQSCSQLLHYCFHSLYNNFLKSCFCPTRLYAPTRFLHCCLKFIVLQLTPKMIRSLQIHPEVKSFRNEKEKFRKLQESQLLSNSWISFFFLKLSCLRIQNAIIFCINLTIMEVIDSRRAMSCMVHVDRKRSDSIFGVQRIGTLRYVRTCRAKLLYVHSLHVHTYLKSLK